MNTMNEHLKYYGKLSLSAVFSLVKINLMGWGTMLITALIGFFALIGSVDFGHAGHLTGESYALILVTMRPVGCSLLALLILSPIFYIVFGNKYVLQKVIYRIVKDKSQDTILPLLDNVINKLRDKQPDAFQKGMNYALVKVKLIQQMQQETENKWQRRICSYALKKIRMDDVDLSQENMDAAEVIRMKTHQYLQSVEKPSRMAIWILFMLQWLFFILIWKTHY